jgi:hypothetical protein
MDLPRAILSRPLPQSFGFLSRHKRMIQWALRAKKPNDPRERFSVPLSCNCLNIVSARSPRKRHPAQQMAFGKSGCLP